MKPGVAITLGVAAIALACVIRTPPPMRQLPCDERGPGGSLPTAKRDSITETHDRDWPDADWARIARMIPGGFAGFYLEHPDSVPRDVPRVDGHPVRQRTIVRLVYPDQKAEALRALRRHFGYRPTGVDLSDPLVVRARWDFAQLFDWYRYLVPHVHAIPGVNMTDIQETENRIVVGATTPEIQQQVLRRVAGLGAPCGLVHTEHSLPVRVSG